MGAGIAEVAAVGGWKARLYDAKAGLAEDAKSKIAARYAKRVQEGKVESGIADGILARVVPCSAMSDMADAELVVEAIVEDLAAKRSLFAELEKIVSPET